MNVLKKLKVFTLPSFFNEHNCYMHGIPIKNKKTRQHIYIISNDIAKKNDWVYNETYSELIQLTSDKNIECYKKIIATTDDYLNILKISDEDIDEYFRYKSISSIEIQYDIIKNDSNSIIYLLSKFNGYIIIPKYYFSYYCYDNKITHYNEKELINCKYCINKLKKL